MAPAPNSPALAVEMFRAGMRVAVAVSGGADSVALLRRMLAERERLGVVLSVAHMHHGIRGAEAEGDAAFVEALALRFSLPFHLERVDVPAAALAHRETLEEAARHLRYAWFRALISQGEVDAVATAHTLDDQAETVLHRLLRGAWTEGLGGILPVLQGPVNAPATSNAFSSPSSSLPVRSRVAAANPYLILRPLLGARRVEIEAWLVSLGQPWRDDSTNLDQAHTRNRLRHSLLPELATFNPQVATQLAHLSTLARDEEDYWQAELARMLPSLLLSGRAVRGGGRATSTQPDEASVAIEVERLRALHPALRRRVLRAAAGRLRLLLDYTQTEQLMALCELGSSSKGIAVGGLLLAQRTVREIRLTRQQSGRVEKVKAETSDAQGPDGGSGLDREVEAKPAEYILPIPGEVLAAAFRLVFRAELKSLTGMGPEAMDRVCGAAVVRGFRSGDRVRLRYSRGPRRIKEVFERLKIAGGERAAWPLIAWENEIVWMQGIEVESERALAAGLVFTAVALESGD